MTYILRPNQLLKMRETLRSIFIFPNESKHKIAERISVTAAEKNNNSANKNQGVTLSRRFVALVENLLNLGYEIKTKVRDENGHPVYHGNSCCSSYGHTPCHNYMTFFKIYCCLNDQNLFLMMFLISSLCETTFTVRQMSDKCNSLFYDSEGDDKQDHYKKYGDRAKLLHRNGILKYEKRKYSISDSYTIDSVFGNMNQNIIDFINFFTIYSPVGLPGFYISNILNIFYEGQFTRDNFIYKFYNPFPTINQEIKYNLLYYISMKRSVKISYFKEEYTGNSRKNKIRITCVPLKILYRQLVCREYLLAHGAEDDNFISVRLDNITSVDPGEPVSADEFNVLSEKLNRLNINSSRISENPDMVKIKFQIPPEEKYVLNRLERQANPNSKIICEDPERHIYAYSSEISDENEMQSWLKTFIGRIVNISTTGKQLGEQFNSDLKQMMDMYNVK